MGGRQRQMCIRGGFRQRVASRGSDDWNGVGVVSFELVRNMLNHDSWGKKRFLKDRRSFPELSSVQNLGLEVPQLRSSSPAESEDVAGAATAAGSAERRYVGDFSKLTRCQRKHWRNSNMRK